MPATASHWQQLNKPKLLSKLFQATNESCTIQHIPSLPFAQNDIKANVSYDPEANKIKNSKIVLE